MLRLDTQNKTGVVPRITARSNVSSINSDYERVYGPTSVDPIKMSPDTAEAQRLPVLEHISMSKASDNSLHSKALSLHSNMSHQSSVRHNLLKPTTPDIQLHDQSLPVQPMLTTANAVVPTSAEVHSLNDKGSSAPDSGHNYDSAPVASLKKVLHDSGSQDALVLKPDAETTSIVDSSSTDHKHRSGLLDDLHATLHEEYKVAMSGEESGHRSPASIQAGRLAQRTSRQSSSLPLSTEEARYWGFRTSEDHRESASRSAVSTGVAENDTVSQRILRYDNMSSTENRDESKRPRVTKEHATLLNASKLPSSVRVLSSTLTTGGVSSAGIGQTELNVSSAWLAPFVAEADSPTASKANSQPTQPSVLQEVIENAHPRHDPLRYVEPVAEPEAATPFNDRKPSVERVVLEAVERFRQVAAKKATSFRDTVGALTYAKPSPEPKDYFDAAVSRDQNKQPAAEWLRNLLPNSQARRTSLTALPPTSRFRVKDVNRRFNYQPLSSTTQMRSGARAEALSETGANGQKLVKFIEDLEKILHEALMIAHEAADKGDFDALPALLAETAAMLGSEKDELKVSTAPSASPLFDRSNLSLSGHDVISSHASVRESLRSFSNSSDMYTTESDLDDSQLYHSSSHELKKGRQSDSPSGILALSSSADGEPDVGIRKASSMIRARSNSNQRALLPSTRQVNRDLETLPSQQNDLVSSTPGLDLLEVHNGTSKPRQFSIDRKPISGRSIETMKLHHEEQSGLIASQHSENQLPNRREVREYIRVFHNPPIQPRQSSLALRKRAEYAEVPADEGITSGFDAKANNVSAVVLRPSPPHSLDGPHSEDDEEIDFATPQGLRKHAGVQRIEEIKGYELQDMSGNNKLPRRHLSGRRLAGSTVKLISLRGKGHVSIDESRGFSLSRSRRRQPIARDWSPIRKRFVAAIACISTALIGLLIGIYAGEVPSIQYYIADFNHYAILGNVFFYIGLSVPTFIFWPLPLLHGRKPYILGAMTLAMPLLFPQAIAVSSQRSPYVADYRVGLILPRAFMGFCLGFAQMNFLAILTDLFGASLQSGNPHQEVVDEYDVRRHGGGLGVWLGIWTWCYVGSIGFGFWIGAWIINTLSPDWGLYVSVIVIAAVLLLNVVTPEVRRSAYRRSVTEVRTPEDVSRRVAKGEVKMHRIQTGPTWWGEEFHHGILLSLDMLRQPGFLIMSLYVAWIYGQIVLIIVLLGSLMSKVYRFTSPIVGVTTLAIPLGALLAVPFQKASLFSRARVHPQRTDSMTFEKRVTWSSHLIRRAIFTLVLPFAGLAYTLSSTGPPTPWILPILFAGLIAFLSNLAIAECNGILMETFDTSDLQPGMTGRPRGKSAERTQYKRTNYSSFPRVSAAFAIVQGFGFLIAAAATGVGGVAQRNLGQQAATGVMAGILLILTVLLLAVLIRWKEVQIIPTSRTNDMERWEQERRESVRRLEESRRHSKEMAWASGNGKNGVPEQPEEDEPWRPVIIGNPSGKTRRMSVLELGHLSRWTEIRRKNRLIDRDAYEGRHPNLAALDSVRGKLIEGRVGSLRRLGRNGSKRSDSASEDVVIGSEHETGDLGERSALAREVKR